MVLLATRCQELGWEWKAGKVLNNVVCSLHKIPLEKDLEFVVANIQSFKLCKFF